MVGSTPVVRLDWWNFWFQEESFPTQLGWVPAHTSVFQFDFITSVSSAVLAASITSTPTSLPPGATAHTAPLPNNLPEQDPSPTVPLFTGTAYVAPTAPSNIRANKRDVEARAVSTLPSSVLSAIASELTAAPRIIQSVRNIVGPAPSKYNFYEQRLDVTSLKNQIAQAQSYESTFLAKVTSLASLTN